MRRNAFNLKRGLFWSVVLHAFVLAVFAGVFARYIPQKEPEVLRVQLVSAAQLAPKKKKLNPKPPKAKLDEVRTQASAAPKEAPKEVAKPQPKPKTKAPKVKAKDLAKAPEKKVEKPKEADKKAKDITQNEKKEAKRRPPKLDKTPDKTKALRSQNEKAKVVDDADDFLAALDFVKDLEKEQKKDTPEKKKDVPETEEETELTLADQADIAALQKHIYEYWIMPPGIEDAEHMTAIVNISVKPDGTLSSLNIVQSSGYRFFDDALLRAVRKSLPLPIPADKYEALREIELHFSGK